MQRYYYCLDLWFLPPKKSTLKYSLATLWKIQAVVFAKVISGIEPLQDSYFCPKILRCETPKNVDKNKSVSADLDGSTKSCNYVQTSSSTNSAHERHGANHSSHMCTLQTHSFNLLGHMENVRIFGTNLGTTWQNQSYKHVAVIAFNPPHAWPFQNLESHVRTCGNQAVCIHLYSRQRGLHELVHVSLASQQSKQTGNFAEIVTYKLHCLHEQIAYICMTHYHVLGIAHDMFFIGNAFAEC